MRLTVSLLLDTKQLNANNSRITRVSILQVKASNSIIYSVSHSLSVTNWDPSLEIMNVDMSA